MTKRAPSTGSDDKPKWSVGEAILPIEVIKRMGAKPGLFILVGFLVTYFKRELNENESGKLAGWLDLLAGGLFSIGVLWWLLRLFAKIFKNRPARGLIDGLSAGILAGIVGGFLGYGWPDTSLYPNIPPDSTFTVDSSPPWMRTFLALIFSIPIGGVLGVGLDLVHTDRKVAWRKKFGTVILVICVFLLIIWGGIFVYVPKVTSMGIRFSDLLALFEWFLIFYSVLVFVSFDWPHGKIFSRLLLMVLGIIVFRLVTYFIPTMDEGSQNQAAILQQFSWPNGTSYWWRTYSLEGTGGATDASNAVLMGMTVVLLCLWTFILYGACYSTHRLTTWMDGKTRAVSKRRRR